ncbi:unnamed protein product [Owenia fusiformis]|uniref:Uncharacterized protein n=1 Tax=Owenia fusiformis TaxID=6347 RepID=A0A8J1XS27_OWEFU|nr:unnamed protein product [Owenia fusiformis]
MFSSLETLNTSFDHNNLATDRDHACAVVLFPISKIVKTQLWILKLVIMAVNQAAVCALLLSVTMVMAADPATAAKFVCDLIVPPEVQNINKSIPIIGTKFEVTVEANFRKKGGDEQMIAHEYYDYANNKAAVHIIRGGKKLIYIYNFQQKELYKIKEEKTCETSDLTREEQMGFNVFNFTVTGNTSYVKSVSDLFNFGDAYNETYMGETVVRGIPVDHWASCVTWIKGDAHFKLDYYFTKEGYHGPHAFKGQIPVRATIEGDSLTEGETTRHNFTHVYEFVNFKAGPIDRYEEVFQPPEGVICVRKRSKPRPILPAGFSLEIEQIDSYEAGPVVVLNRQYFFDFKNQLMRMDERPSKYYGEKYYKEFNNSDRLSIIHDYNTGHEYIIDQVLENCTIRNITDGEDVHKSSSNPLLVSMKAGYELFNLNMYTFSYAGQRQYRSVLCDIWIVSFSPAGTTDESAYGNYKKIRYEVYFLADNWTSDMLLANQSEHVLVAIRMKGTAKRDKHTGDFDIFMNIFSYRVTAPSIDVFDIDSCVNYSSSNPEINYKHLVFTLPVRQSRLLSLRQHNVVPAVRKAIAMAAQVSGIRVNDIFFMKAGDYVDTWFTLLAPPKTQGDVAVEVTSLDKAYKNLQEVIASQEGLKIRVKYKAPDQSLSFTVAKDSLKTDKEKFDPRSNNDLCQMSGYTGGAMAGLAFAMILVGFIGGIGLGFYLWKRNTGIPYRLQE